MLIGLISAGQERRLRAQISDILQDLGEILEPQRDLVCEELEVLELSLTAVKAAKDYIAKVIDRPEK